MKPYILGYLNERLQHVCCTNKSFQDKAVVFLGDFDQLPPPGGMSRNESAVTIGKGRHTPPDRKICACKIKLGITLVIRKGVKLTTQNRSKTRKHMELPSKMSGGGVGGG